MHLHLGKNCGNAIWQTSYAVFWVCGLVIVDIQDLLKMTMVLCVNLTAKEMAFIFLQKCFWKQLMFCCSLSTCKKCVYRIFSRYVKKVFGENGFKQDVEKLWFGFKIKYSRNHNFMCIHFLTGVFPDSIKRSRLCCLTFFVDTKKKKVEAIKTSLESNSWYVIIKLVAFFIMNFISILLVVVG